MDAAYAALGAEMRDDGAGEVDRAEHVRVELGRDLLLRALLGGAEQRVAGVRDDDVDPAEVRERPVHDGPDRRAVADVERVLHEAVRVRRAQVVEGAGAANGGGYAIAACKDGARELATEAG